MKIPMAILASMLAAWLFYFLVEAFFVSFEFTPIVLVGVAALILFVFSRNVQHVISRLFFIMAVESLMVPLSALLHTLNSDQDFLSVLQKDSRRPDFIVYLRSAGWDTESVVMVALGFTLVFSLFCYFLSPQRNKMN